LTRLLVDGTGVAVRTWWANPSGCAARFQAAIRRAIPTAGADVIVCWDCGPSWRREIYPSYKANRGPKPEGLLAALKECRRIYPGWEAEGYEADDLIGTLAPVHELGGTLRASDVTLVLSDDKDLLQLVVRDVLVVNSGGTVYDVAAVEKKMGVPPHRIRHLLSWMGDTADGLPGVPGYGPVKAAKKALAGEIGNSLTYELTELATVPSELWRKP
jgi:DNA polymerase-1